ncbi:MAG: RNA methyltransferase [Sphingobacteriaceae bacterium]|nr:RNA methyltransferase [Cytophagaceae bacterium]
MRKLQTDELNRLTLPEFHSVEKLPYVLVLDSVRSLLNVGSIFRSADAFRCERLYLCGITGTPPHRELAKTALGAEHSVAWTYAPDAGALVGQLRAEGFVVCAIEQTEGSISLAAFEPQPGQRYAFVLGNEVNGVSEAVVERADFCLEIPQFGTKHSLNVAVVAGIVAWDFVSKRLTINLTRT